jgi:hypothetical protein
MKKALSDTSHFRLATKTKRIYLVVNYVLLCCLGESMNINVSLWACVTVLTFFKKE